MARAPDLGVLGVQGPTSFESETRLFNCLRRHFRVGAERHPPRSEPTVGCTIRAAARPTPRQGAGRSYLEDQHICVLLLNPPIAFVPLLQELRSDYTSC